MLLLAILKTNFSKCFFYPRYITIYIIYYLLYKEFIECVLSRRSQCLSFPLITFHNIFCHITNPLLNRTMDRSHSFYLFTIRLFFYYDNNFQIFPSARHSNWKQSILRLMSILFPYEHISFKVVQTMPPLLGIYFAHRLFTHFFHKECMLFYRQCFSDTWHHRKLKGTSTAFTILYECVGRWWWWWLWSWY